MRNRVARLAGPALVSLLLCGVAVALGAWQIGRLDGKRRLVAAIAHGESAPAVPLAAGAVPGPFAKVTVTGSYRANDAAYYGAEVRDTRAGSTMGSQLVSVLDRDGAPPLLVVRGWVPSDQPPPAPPEGLVTVEGFVHASDRRGPFSAKDDVAHRRFYTLDAARLGEGMGVGRVAPFLLVALGKDGAPPIPAPHLPTPANDHLGYALTWFALALAIAAIFAGWARREWHARDRA